MLGRTVPFSHGRLERLLELGNSPRREWSHSQDDGLESGIFECAEPPLEVVLANTEWDFNFRKLANDIALEIGMVAESR